MGSGLTGLVATYILTAPTSNSSNGVKVTVDIFERAAALGMDSASISVPLPPASSSATTASPRTISSCLSTDDSHGTLRPRPHKRLKLETRTLSDAGSIPQRSMRIDVPMRAFTGGYYPQLLALYCHLGIRIKKTNFTYSFAALPPSTAAAVPCSATLSSPSSTTSSSGTRPSSPQSESTAAATWPPSSSIVEGVQAPSPSILYNGANGVRGVSLPADLRQPRLSNPARVSNILDQISRIRAYFASLVLLVLGYFQLLVIALWHHHLGHTCDPSHPLRTHTLSDLVSDPFPTRSPAASRDPSHSLRSRLGLVIEPVVESLLRRTICLDERFAQQTLTPLFSAVMTSSLDSVWSCPASEVLDYVALTLGKDHFVVKDGVRTVVATLLNHVDQQQTRAQQSARSNSSSSSSSSKVWTSAEVRRVQSKAGKAWIDVVHHDRESSPQKDTADTQDMSREPSSTSTDRTFWSDQDQLQQHGPFDHVIFATQANQTAHFLEQYVDSLTADDSGKQEAERLGRVIDVLNTFRYERSVVVNHTDRALLPRDDRDWRDLNLVSPSQVGAKQVWTAEKRRSSTDSDWTDDHGEELDGSASNDTLWSLSSGPTSKPPKSTNGYTMATHVLALPPPASHSPLFILQTTNPLPPLHPNPNAILSRSTFERAIIDLPAHLSRSALFHPTTPSHPHNPNVKTAGGRVLTLGPLQQQRQRQGMGKKEGEEGGVKVWVCGSWAVGIPLLEGCVVSARLVAQEILSVEGVRSSEWVKW